MTRTFKEIGPTAVANTNVAVNEVLRGATLVEQQETIIAHPSNDNVLLPNSDGSINVNINNPTGTVELGSTSLNALENITVHVDNIASTVTVTNFTDNGLTDTQLRASAVPVTGTVIADTGLVQPLTDTQLRATALPVSVASLPSHPVTGTFWQATQPVSGTVTVSNPTAVGLTDTELRATAVPVSIASVPSHAVTNAGTFSVQVTSAPTTTVTATALPLPTGAATETTLSALNTKVTAVNTGAVTISSALPTGGNVIGIVRSAGQTTPGFSVTGLSPVLTGGADDAGNMQALSLDTSGKQNVNVAASVLPTGASTDATLAALKSVQDTIQSQTEIIEYALMALLDKIAMPDRFDRSRVVIGDTTGNEINGPYYGVNVAIVGDSNLGKSYARVNEIWNMHDAGSTRIYNNITVV
jgi:hypothetical protein